MRKSTGEQPAKAGRGLYGPALCLLFALLTPILASGQAVAPYSLMPAPVTCFTFAPLGYVYSYQANTTNAWPTYTDSTGNTQNTNPVALDANGCAGIWLGAASYKIIVKSSTLATLYTVNYVQNQGAIAQNLAVLLAPAGAAEQDVIGPLGANYFVGLANHTTSPNVRVALLAPTTVLDSASNPPNVITVAPAGASQNYRIPDPLGHANFVLSPDSGQAGLNVLDCTATGITCKRSAYAYFEGGGCNNTTAGLGWDTFGSNSPDPICVTGTNIQKGVMAFRSAATKYQSQTANGNCNTTCTLTYPQATAAGDLLVAVIAVDGAKTVSSVSDGTNAYSKAINKTNGNYDVEIWYFNGNSTAMSASSTLTLTLSAQANAAWEFMSYKDVKTSGILDVTASTNGGPGTAVTTGTTVGTAQNTELVLAAFASDGAPTVTHANGWTGHSIVSQSTNVTVGSAGLIQQATTTQSGSFTLGSSQTWAGVIATFKANVANTTTAQRQFRLPGSFQSSVAINAVLNWQAPKVPTGTVNVKLGAALVCTAPGSTDDPAFLTATTATAQVSASAANIITDTPLNSLTATGCAAGNLLHFQAQRLRYDANDTYEGYVYLNGAGLSFGTD